MNKPNNILEHEVRDELDWDPYLDAARVTVKADAGKVVLSGVVYSYPESLHAEDDAWSVKGVTDVEDRLLIGFLGEAIADADLARECVEALDADELVPKGSVTVEVGQGWVTMYGRVRHHFQRMAAKHDIGRIKGVLGISDKVTIDADPAPSDVQARITAALERNSLLHDAEIEVSNEGNVIYLDGTVQSYAARSKAEDVAWSAPGVSDVIDRIRIIY
jgi:osmotically-inducible protein OsmY